MVTLNRNGSLEAHKLCSTESVKHVLCGRSLPGLVLQTVADQVLHVWPWRTPVVLYVIDWTALGGGAEWSGKNYTQFLLIRIEHSTTQNDSSKKLPTVFNRL